MLRTAMGHAIVAWLEDPAIVEIMLNPHGRLWIDRLAGGLSDTGKRLSAEDGERILRVVAHQVAAEGRSGSPRIFSRTADRRALRRPPAANRQGGHSQACSRDLYAWRLRPRRHHDDLGRTIQLSELVCRQRRAR
jgi:hypothetical protein